MNPDLIDGLARVADSSENLPQLRRLVVALAISGKLDVPGEEDSVALMRERLTEERKRLEKIGKLKHPEELNPVSSDELPFEVSNLCCFERLGNLAVLAKGETGIQSAIPGPFPLVVTAEGRSSCDHFDFDGAAAIVPMVSSAGHGKASIKRLHYQEGRFALGNILCAIFPISDGLISARFLYEYLTAFKEDLLVTRMIGTANVSLTIGKIAEVPVPLVSRRIQQRVDELMALCDRLEAAQTERESRRDPLVASSLNRLNNGADAEAFSNHARFYFNHLPRLTTKPEHILQLRQTILNLAVRGKLVRQISRDESAESLLSEIHKVHATAPSRRKSVDVDDSDQKFIQHLPGTLPSNWAVCPLEDLFRFIDYRGRTPTRTHRGVRLITAKNVRMGHLSDEPIEFIDEQDYVKWMTRGFPRNGDLLFVTEGATMGYVGAIELSFKFALAQRTIDLQPYLSSYSRFFLFTLMSPVFQEAVMTNSTGTAVKGIKAAKLKRIRVFLPPLAEQQRIVAKVDELMALCDRLEAQLTTTHSDSRRLLEAVLHEALAGQSELEQGVLR